MARVHDIVDRRAVSEKDFVALVEEVRDVVDSAYQRDDALIAAAKESKRRGLLQLARDCLRDIDRQALMGRAPYLLADVLYDGGQWEEAAREYLNLWQYDHHHVAALYLSGVALQNASRDAEGERRKQRAMCMALDDRTQLHLARELQTRGLVADAKQQFELLLRTAPPQHWAWNEAARYLGEIHLHEQPEVAATLMEHARLDDLRTGFYLLDDKDYLNVPAAIERLRALAACLRGQPQDAAQHIQSALAILPGQTLLAEQLVPRLQQSGAGPVADDLVNAVAEYYTDQLGKFPHSAYLHNNLAWLFARCGQRLDEALHHAMLAVKFAPQKASYLDTLAEVHFQRGDRQSALELSRQAVQLRPGDSSLQQQLAKFQSATLP